MLNPGSYGLQGEYEPKVMHELVKSYYRYGFGWTPKGMNPRKNKEDLPILLGTLNGNATVIVKKKNPTSCKGLYPEVSQFGLMKSCCPERYGLNRLLVPMNDPQVTPAHGGSQMFMYQADVSSTK